MKKKIPSRSAFSNPRILLSFAFLFGVLLALLVFVTYPGATALAQNFSFPPADESAPEPAGPAPTPACLPMGGGQHLFSYRASDNHLISFASTAPGTLLTDIAVVGVTAGETLVGIDFRPQNGHLYSLGVTAAGAGTLYNISTRTGVATVIGTAGGVTPTAPMPDPSLATSGFGFDFNPLVDRIRVVTSAGQSFVIDPNTGLVAANAPTLNGATTTADGTSYTNNQPNAIATTLYTIDSASDTLYLQNAGTSTTTAVGAVGFDFTRLNGFDIPAGVNVATSGTPVVTGSAFAILNVGGTTGLYSINLVTGAGTFIGNVGSGATPVQGLAIQNDLGGFPAIALDASGPNIVRFNTATPGTTTTVAMTGVAAGETVVDIDFRPATGQLFTLGINAGSNTGTLYRVDPQTGAAVAIGVPGQVAFTTDGVTAVDLPSTATSGYGFDFNPVADRVRVTTSSGLNFRINPITGAPVDGDNTGLTSGTVTGINPDGSINGSGSTGVSGNAYTNNFGQGAGGPTTLYTLDAASNSLLIQNPPNTGTQTMPLPVTLSGGPLDFTNVNGFDLPGRVSVATSNSPATGFGFAVLTVGSTTSVYQLDLSNAVATSLGTLGPGASPMAGFTLGDTPEICAVAPTPTPTPTPTATPTPTPTATPTPTPPPLTTQAINLSTRMRVGTGDQVGIGGFIITGSAMKHVLLRSIGPSLTRFDIPNVLADPVLELHGPGAFATITNNNWRDTQQTSILLTNLAPTHDLESAIDVTLAPGAYTAIVTGNGSNKTGVALIEVYDLDQPAPSKLANLSTRALVGSGGDIVIAGFVLSDNTVEDRIVVRGIGPSLAPSSVPANAVLANPVLERRDSNGAVLISNNDWQDNPVQAAELAAAGLAPTNSLESRIPVSLP